MTDLKQHLSDFCAFIASSVTQVEDVKEEPKMKTTEPGEPVEEGSTEVTGSELAYNLTKCILFAIMQKHLLRGVKVTY